MRAGAPLLAAGALLVAVGVALTGVHAASALMPVPQARDGLLRLEASAQPAWFDGIGPGETRYLRIAAHLEGAPSGAASLELRKDGELVEHSEGLELRLRSCSLPWTAVPVDGVLDVEPGCPGQAREITTAGPAHDYRSASPVWPLGQLDRASSKQLLLSVHLPADGTDRALLEGRFAVGLHAQGAELDTLGEGLPGSGTAASGRARPLASLSALDGLPALGAAPMPALALAAGLLLLGLGLRRRRAPRA